MAITVRQQIDNAVSGTAAISLTLSSAVVGDTVLVIHADNFHTLADMTVPTGTAVSSYGTVKFTGDGGTDDNHVKVWMGTVTTASGTVVEGTGFTDHERYLGAWVWQGPVNFDTAAFTDSDVASTSFVAPSVTPTAGKTDDQLVCVWMSNPGFQAETDITPPGGMTARTERDAVFCTFRGADEQLTSDAATGTRTAASLNSHAWAAVSVLVSSIPAGGLGSAAPGRTWERRFHHRQQIPTSAIAVTNLTGDVSATVTATDTVTAVVGKIGEVSATVTAGGTVTAVVARFGAVDASVFVDSVSSASVTAVQLFFTPPHRGQFMPYSIEHTETDTQPLKRLKPDIPRPPNIFVWSDGTLHENQQEDPNPQIPGWSRRIYAGGHIYGPLTNAEITELTNAGYGAYLTTDPTPEPQP